MVKLKPCPFCGESARLYSSYLGDAHFVKCDSCQTEIKAYPTEEEARSVWNTRTGVLEDSLESCPFCGGRATVFRRERTFLQGDEEVYWVVECDSCPAAMERFVTKEAAIRMWNRRG